MARLAMVALVVVASVVLAAPAGGFAQQTGVAADIRQGHCEEIGDVVVPLVAATIPAGDPRGNAAAIPAATSFTTIPLSLEALTASEHAIVVPFPAGEELVACGEIGGALTEAGALVVGIRPQGELGISGIAFLSPGADPAQTNVSLFVRGDALDEFLAATFSPPTVAEEDAARFAAALAARDSSPSLAGPIAGQFVQREGLRTVQGAGIAAADFSATATFVNPTEQTETPWEVGFVFARIPGRDAQNVYLDSGGSWYSTGGPSGFVRAFDTAPGAANTLDLVVEGDEALFGVNGAFVASLDLPTPPGSGLMLGTGFSSDHVVEGREIGFRDFSVWR